MAFDPFRPEPPKFSEVYEKFSNLDSTNSAYKGRFTYGFGKELNTAVETAAKNRLKMNQGDALDLFIKDKGTATLEKVYRGMNFKPEPGVPVERGTLSELAVRGQDILSIKTRVIDRCIKKAEDPDLNSKIRDLYKKKLSDLKAMRKELLNEGSRKLDELIRKGETPDDALLLDLLYNGFRYWEIVPDRVIRNRFYDLARERQADMLRSAMEKASPRSRKQFARMLEDLYSTKPSYQEDGSMRKFLKKVGEMLLDVGLESLVETIGDVASNWMVLPVLGPAPTPQPSSPEADVFSWIIEGHEKRGLTPPKYDDLKDGQKQLSDALKMLKEWVMADEKAFWKSFRPQITPQSEAVTLQSEAADPDDATLAPVAVDLAEQIHMLQTHLLWAERLDQGKHPWLWEVASDKTDLVAELSQKYLNKGPDAMYDHVGGYSYRSKRPLARHVACELASEALEGVLATVTNIDAGEIHEEGQDGQEVEPT